MERRAFSGRAFTSLLSLVGLILMGVSGLVLYFVPQGRVAYWVDWRLIGLSKTQWGDVHILGSVLFLVAAGFHLYFNWKPLINYLSKKAAAALRYGRELALATVLLLWVAVSGLAPFPPLSWVLDFSNYLKEAWVITAEYEPPFGHAELLTLKGFCRKMFIPLEPALAALKKAGLKKVAPETTLLAMAQANNKTPLEVYRLIKGLAKEPVAAKGEKWTAAKLEARFAGSGLGGKPLAEAAGAVGLTPLQAKGRLLAAGIKAEPTASLRSIASGSGKTPLELMKIMLEIKD